MSAVPRMANASTGLGRICFITGSSTPKSIGRESTLLLAKHGARIVATDLPSMQGQGEELVQEIKKMGGEAIWVPLDVTKEEQWGPAIARAEKEYGPLDVLFNNAGIYAEAPFNDHISKHPTHLYDKTMEVNAKGVYFGIKYAAGSMIKRQVKESASIVNTSSIAGLAGNVGTFAYTMSKFAVTGSTKWAAQALAINNIRVNGVHPGTIHTTLIDPIFEAGAKPSDLDKWSPMGRMARPDEVAAVVLFLASNESSYVSGGEYLVDGALMATSGLAGATSGAKKV